MKHSIRTNSFRLSVEPVSTTDGPAVLMTFTAHSEPLFGITMTPEQAGLLSQAFDLVAEECGNDGDGAARIANMAAQAGQGINHQAIQP